MWKPGLWFLHREQSLVIINLPLMASGEEESNFTLSILCGHFQHFMYLALSLPSKREPSMKAWSVQIYPPCCVLGGLAGKIMQANRVREYSIIFNGYTALRHTEETSRPSSQAVEMPFPDEGL